MKWGPDMFGNANKKARKKAMKMFKGDRRDIFEGLSDEGRGKVVDALQTRLRELKGRNETDISANSATHHLSGKKLSNSLTSLTKSAKKWKERPHEVFNVILTARWTATMRLKGKPMNRKH